MAGSIEPYRDRIASGRWFSRISPELQDCLIGNAQLRRLAAGSRLFARGEEADGLYCVLDGALRISGTAASGKEALLLYLEPPNWFGEIALFDAGPRTHDAWAVDACTLLHVPRAALTSLLDAHPQYWRELAQLLADKLRLTFVALEAMVLMPAQQRVRQRLAMIADGYGDGRADPSGNTATLIRIPQDELAQMVALSRQTTNQILKELEAQGVLRLQRGGIEVLDRDALRHP